MKIYHKKSDYHNYISFSLQEIGMMEQKMLLHNNIEGILSCDIKNIGDRIELDYEIDGKVDLHEFLENRMIGKKELLLFYQSFFQTISNMRSFLFPINRLFLSPKSIFINSVDGKFFFCCIPSYDQDIMVQVQNITELLLKYTDHKEQEAVFFIYGFYQMLQQSNVSIAMLEQYVKQNSDSNIVKSMTKESDSEFKKQLDIKTIELNCWEEQMRETETQVQELRDTIIREEKTMIYQEDKSNQGVKKTNNKKKILIHSMTQIALLILCFLCIFITIRSWQSQNRKNLIIGIGMISILIVFMWDRERTFRKMKNTEQEQKSYKKIRNYDRSQLRGDKTVVLSQNIKSEKDRIPYLQDLTEKGGIEIYHTPLVIGTLQEAVDIVVQGKGISRIHASIECEAQQYYIRDLNSTNGTEWNGERLLPQIPRELQAGDIIMIGNHRYKFVF